MTDVTPGIIVGLLATGIYFLGFRNGRSVGKAEGWNEKYFADVARDRARREKNGRFKSGRTV